MFSRTYIRFFFLSSCNNFPSAYEVFDSDFNLTSYVCMQVRTYVFFFYAATTTSPAHMRSFMVSATLTTAWSFTFPRSIKRSCLFLFFIFVSSCQFYFYFYFYGERGRERERERASEPASERECVLGMILHDVGRSVCVCVGGGGGERERERIVHMPECSLIGLF